MHKLMICFVLCALISSNVNAQPTTAPTTGRTPMATIPRDQQPFTNESLTDLNPNLPTLFIAGDSTAARGNPGTRGWAALLVDYFDTTKVNLVNRAIGGQRFNTYGPTWDGILGAMKPGDFVVIELGHNNGPLAGI